jgi:hypothetical protein
MNRITSPHLPRARAILDAFASEGSGSRLSAKDQAKRQRSPGGWPVPRDRLAAELRARLDGATLPHQRGTSYCGCAAFLYCVLEDRPDWYVAYATALWRGEPFTFKNVAGRTSVSVAEGTRGALSQIQSGKARGGSISDLDWMTMASLSAATRWSGGAPTSARPTDRGASITWPWMVEQWFASVGAPAKLNSVGVGLLKSSMEELLELLDRWAGYWLVIQIDASLLYGGPSSIQQRHWVVIDPETPPMIQPAGQAAWFDPRTFSRLRRDRRATALRQVNDAHAGQAVVDAEDREDQRSATRLRVVSWGNEHHPLHGATIGNVADRFYGGYAFPRFGRT